ncbi:MAG: OmpA family outer membrane protein [Bacteroidetes bacterium]|nr:OmpA family outer membrane protein [Bacteroidota bacterium]
MFHARKTELFMRNHLLTILALFLCSMAQAQFLTGLEGSAYGGVSAVTFNPAIANSPFVADINLVGVSASVNNNYIGIDRKYLLHPTSTSNFQNDFLHERLNGNNKNAYFGMQLQGPLSFMFSFGNKKKPNKNAIAITYHTNFIFNADNVSETLARSAYYGMGSQADAVTHFVGKSLSNANLGIKTLAWNDFGITYSRVVYEKDLTTIKVGGTLKILQPLIGGYVYSSNLNYKWPELNSLSINRTNISYAYSQGLITSRQYAPQDIAKSLPSYAKDVLNYKYATPTAAVDMGVVYELRPDKDDRGEQMNCGGSWSGYIPKPYKLAVGVSVIDFGAIRFKRGEYSGNFNADVQNWDVSHVKFPNGVQSVDDTIRSRFRLLQDNKGYFTMWLPTRFNLFVDYNIWHGLGVMGTAIISPNMSPNGNMVHQVSVFTGTAKYENKWFGAYIPVSVDVYGNMGLGMTLRAGPLVIGTQDILCLFAKKYVYNAEVHASVKITIPYFKTYHKYDVRFAKKTGRGM